LTARRARASWTRHEPFPSPRLLLGRKLVDE
jgi:hypothetical protein